MAVDVCRLPTSRPCVRQYYFINITVRRSVCIILWGMFTVPEWLFFQTYVHCAQYYSVYFLGGLIACAFFFIVLCFSPSRCYYWRVCVYVCMYVWVCVWVSSHRHVYVCVWLSVCVGVCVPLFVCVWYGLYFGSFLIANVFYRSIISMWRPYCNHHWFYRKHVLVLQRKHLKIKGRIK